MTVADNTTWQDVARVLVLRWPAGPGNKGWEREQIDGYIGELQVDKLTPVAALVGLRASGSAFIPSVGEVRTLSHDTTGTPTLDEVQAAEDAARRRWVGVCSADPPQLTA